MKLNATAVKGLGPRFFPVMGWSSYDDPFTENSKVKSAAKHRASTPCHFPFSTIRARDFFKIESWDVEAAWVHTQYHILYSFYAAAGKGSIATVLPKRSLRFKRGKWTIMQTSRGLALVSPNIDGLFRKLKKTKWTRSTCLQQKSQRTGFERKRKKSLGLPFLGE